MTFLYEYTARFQTVFFEEQANKSGTLRYVGFSCVNISSITMVLLMAKLF